MKKTFARRYGIFIVILLGGSLIGLLLFGYAFRGDNFLKEVTSPNRSEFLESSSTEEFIPEEESSLMRYNGIIFGVYEEEGGVRIDLAVTLPVIPSDATEQELSANTSDDSSIETETTVYAFFISDAVLSEQSLNKESLEKDMEIDVIFSETEEEMIFNEYLRVLNAKKIEIIE